MRARLLLWLGIPALALTVPAWLVAEGMGTPQPATTDAPAYAPEAAAQAKAIALSFDDVPRGPGAFYSPQQRTRLLIAGLKSAGVSQAAFFVNPGRIAPATGGDARVQAYVDAGHVIGDHSFSHRDLSAMSAPAFLADVDRAEHWLKGRAGYRPWFRFPGLNQGGHDEAKRALVLDGLRDRGLMVAAVTVDAADWNLDGLATTARRSGAAIDEDALKRLYIESMVRAADFADDVMHRAIGRSPPHMLLLHETDLAARYIGPLVAALRADGWRIVTADAVYADPLYAERMAGPANGTLTEALGWHRHVKGPLNEINSNPGVGARLFAREVLHQSSAVVAN